MSEQNKQTLIRWFEEVWNQARPEVIGELLPADAVLHEGQTESKGPEGFMPFYNRLRAAFSDIHVTPHEAISEGDMACLRWSVTMRHTGDGLGLPATGKQVQTTGISMVRFRDGRFAEGWQNWDMLGVMLQLQRPQEAESPLHVAGRIS